MKKKGNNNNKTNMAIWVNSLLVMILIIAGVVGVINHNNNKGGDENQSSNSHVDDYVGKDAREAYNTLEAAGYDVRFVFDRANNGGFTEDGFQEYILQEFDIDSYSELPYVVTGQSANGKTITLKVDYSTVVESNNAQAQREEALEKKLGIVESMTACQQYGERNYSGFKMHSILGKIAEYASDDDTWFLKYTVDADGRKNMTMECSVTGTSANPAVKSFMIY